MPGSAHVTQVYRTNKKNIVRLLYDNILGYLKMSNFPSGTMENLLFLGVPILKHIMGTSFLCLADSGPAKMHQLCQV